MSDQQEASAAIPPRDASTPPRFVALVTGIVRRPRATLERIGALPRRPWRRMALLVLLAVILPVVATYSVSMRQFAARSGMPAPVMGSEGVSSARMAPPGKVGAVSSRGMGYGGEPSMEQVMPAPAPSPLATLVLPALGRFGGLALSWLVWTGVLYILGTMMGGRNTFGHMFTMVVWTWIPFAVRGILQAAFIWITGEPIAYSGLSGLLVNEPSAQSFAAPISTGTLMLQGLLKQVDVYLFWHLALVIVGLMAVARLPRRKAITLAIASWALLTLLSLVPTLVMGSFAGMRMG